MEQRPLRLGNLVDDYCPRERRVTNHVIVAIVDDAIRQTRCTTCDAEHVYKAAKAPRRRKKDDGSALYDEVLASVAGSQLVAPSASAAEPDAGVDGTPAINGKDATPPPALAADADRAPARHADSPPGPPVIAVPESNGNVVDNRADDHWPANRPLIRATLPKTENDQPIPRPIPEFTMHQRHGRGGHGFRHGQGWQGQGQGQGGNNGGGRGGFRPGRSANGQGQGQGQGQGFGRGPGRPGQGQADGNRGRHQGKKRSR